MGAAAHTFPIEQGTTFNPVLRLKVKSTGVPIDLTGSDFLMHIREEDQDGPLIQALSISNGGVIILDASDGKFQLFISDTDTDAFTEAEFAAAVFDLDWKDSLGTVKRLLEGCATLSLNITRPGP